MEPLKVTTQVINLVDSSTLEAFVEESYKLTSYSFAAVEECGNDSDHAFHVDGNLDEDDDEEDIKLIREGKEVPTYRNALLLDILCHDGLIPPGNYLIQVSW